MLRWHDENNRVALGSKDVCYSRPETTNHRHAALNVRELGGASHGLVRGGAADLGHAGARDVGRSLGHVPPRVQAAFEPLLGGGGTGKFFVVTNVANMCTPGTFVKHTRPTRPMRSSPTPTT